MNWTVRGIIIAVVVAGMAWLWLDRSDPGSEADPSAPVAADPTPVSSQPAVPSEASGLPAEVVEPAETVPQPTPEPAELLATQSMIPPPEQLRNSDEEFLALVGSLNEELPSLLTAPDQIRKWVLFVHLAAQGKTAHQHRPFKLPYRSFQVIEKGDRVFLDPANYARYDALVDAVTAIPAQSLASYFRFWQPLLEEAYSDMGEPVPLEDRVNGALQQILSAPVLEGDIELERPSSVMYRYKDAKLEKASAIHKWLWRTGPENTRQLQAYFRDVQRYLQ